MQNGVRISVILPCYNEADNLGIILLAIPVCVDQVIVVDNGSVDETRGVAQSWGAQVVDEPRRGMGFAHQRGLACATGDIIVGLDAEATYPVNAIPALVELMRERQLDFISEKSR